MIVSMSVVILPSLCKPATCNLILAHGELVKPAELHIHTCSECPAGAGRHELELGLVGNEP